MAPPSAECHAARAEVYRTRRDAEVSLMAKDILGAAAAASAPGPSGGPTDGLTNGSMTGPALPAGPKGEGN